MEQQLNKVKTYFQTKTKKQKQTSSTSSTGTIPIYDAQRDNFYKQQTLGESYEKYRAEDDIRSKEITYKIGNKNYFR